MFLKRRTFATFIVFRRTRRGLTFCSHFIKKVYKSLLALRKHDNKTGVFIKICTESERLDKHLSKSFIGCTEAIVFPQGYNFSTRNDRKGLGTNMLPCLIEKATDIIEAEKDRASPS